MLLWHRSRHAVLSSSRGHHHPTAVRDLGHAWHSDRRARGQAHLCRGVREEAQGTAAVDAVAAKLSAIPEQ